MKHRSVGAVGLVTRRLPLGTGMRLRLLAVVVVEVEGALQWILAVDLARAAARTGAEAGAAPLEPCLGATPTFHHLVEEETGEEEQGNPR